MTAPDHDCRGPVSFGLPGRRAFLQAGLAGFASLSLPGLLKLRSRAAETPTTGSGEKKAVIMVWQPGGLSHIDSYDPKPDSGSEYAGPFKPIATKVPDLNFTELLPRQAAMASTSTVNNQLSPFQAERVDSINEAARSSNSILNYATLGIGAAQGQSIDDDRPRNPRPRLSATGPMVTSGGGRGVTGYYDRAGSYFPTMRGSTYRNPGLPARRR